MAFDDDGREPDELVAALRPPESLAGAPDLVVLTGYFGTGPGDTVRIYADVAMRRYIELPASAVKFRKRIDQTDEFGARSHVWVDADVLRTPIVHSEDVITHFADKGLGGQLPRDLLQAAQDITLVAVRTSTKYCMDGPAGPIEEGPGPSLTAE
jgi:hypothetical protein